MNAATRAFVRARGQRRCEYCRIHEDDLPAFPFHIEHIVATKHGGTDERDNLAWSCHHCNLAKSSNLSGIDPVSGRLAPLFNPRTQNWVRHFKRQGPKLVGRTSSGRATIVVLNVNSPQRIDLRRLLIMTGQFPPDEHPTRPEEAAANGRE